MSEPRPHNEAELLELLGAVDVRAPQALHERVQALVDQSAADGRGARRGLWQLPGRAVLGGSMTALAVLAIGLVLALSGGSTPGLTVKEASTLTLRAATMGAPAESARVRGALAESVGNIAFPSWSYAFGYRPSGARVDRVGGQTVTTVFYTDARGRRVGYAIAAGAPAPRSSGGVVRWREGTPYRLIGEAGGVSVVTWVRDGHLCVIAARDVAPAELLALASWHPRSS
jgi:hypothetical protein